MFVRTRGQRCVIDEQKIKDEAHYYDGKWVLTTNTGHSASEVVLKYKQLWMVEVMFRSMKSLLGTRPMFHKCDATIRGHLFCSFLALPVPGIAGSAGLPGLGAGMGRCDP